MAEAWENFGAPETAPTSAAPAWESFGAPTTAAKAAPAWENFGAEEKAQSFELDPVQQEEYHALLKNPNTTPEAVSAWSDKNGFGAAVGNVQKVLDYYKQYPDAPKPTSILHLNDPNKVPNAETGMTSDLPEPTTAEPTSPTFAATPGWGKVADYIGEKFAKQDWELNPDTRKFFGGDNTLADPGQPLHLLKPVLDAPANAANILYDVLPALGVVGSMGKDALNTFLPDLPNPGEEDKGSTGVGDVLAEVLSNPMMGTEIFGLAGASAASGGMNNLRNAAREASIETRLRGAPEGVLDMRKPAQAPVAKDPNAPKTKADLANEKFGTQEAEAAAAPAPKKGKKLNDTKPFVPDEAQTAHRQAVEDVAKQTMDGWTNAPNLNVAHSTTNLPAAVQRDIAKSANPKGVKAVIDPDGTVHILAHRLKDSSEATAIVYHEGLGHHGLTQKFGADLDKTLENFYNNSSLFRARVDRWLKENPGAYAGREDTIARAADEVFAEWSEKGPLQTTLTNKIKNVIKDYARKAGLNKVEYSDRELEQILGEAHNNIIYGSEWGQKGKTRFVTNWRDQFHGTPVNKFEGRDKDNPHGKFLNEKMGTGEGAQAFAWGHYTAENAGISDNQYRKNLLSRKGGAVHVEGKKIEQWMKDHFPKRQVRNPEVTDYPPSPRFPNGRPAGRKRAAELGKPLYLKEDIFSDPKEFLEDFADVVKGDVSQDYFYERVEKMFEDAGQTYLWPDVRKALDKMFDHTEIRGVGRGQLFKVAPDVKRVDYKTYLSKPFSIDNATPKPVDPVFMNYSAPFHEQPPLVQRILREHGGERWDPKAESALNAEHASVTKRLDEVETELDHLNEIGHPDDASDIYALEVEKADLEGELQDIESRQRKRAEPIGEHAYFSDLGKNDDTGNNFRSLSEALHARGVHGVKFLDGNSRHMSWDSKGARYNHVYFDGNDLKIVDKIDTDKEMVKFTKVADAVGAKLQDKSGLSTRVVDVVQELISDLVERNLQLPDIKDVMELVDLRAWMFKESHSRTQVEVFARDLLDGYRKGLNQRKSRFASAPRSLTPTKMETTKDLTDVLEFMGDTVPKGKKVSQRETIAAAAELGITLPKYLQNGNITEKLAAQLRGAHELLTTTMDNLAALGEKAEKEGLTPATKATIAQHLAIAQAVYGKFAADAAEVGRALNILKVSSLSKGFGEAAGKFASEGGIAGLVHNDEDLIRFLNGVRAVKANGGNAAVAKYVARFHKALPEDYIKLVVFNSMLSSPVTAWKNLLGAPMNFAMDLVADTSGAAIGKFVPGPSRSFQEIASRMYGALDAFRQWDSYTNVYNAVTTGVNTVSKPFYAHRTDIMRSKFAIPLKAPGRLLAGVDEMWANIFHMSNLRGIAVTEALKKGPGNRADLARRINDLVNNPTPEMIEEADRITNRQLFRAEPSKLVKAIGRHQQPVVQDQLHIRMEVDPKTGKAQPVGKTVQEKDGVALRSARLGLSVAVPFMTTTENIVRSIVRNSGPLALFNKEIRADLMAGGAARHSAMGRIALSSAFMAYIVDKANSGEITGAPSPDWNHEKELSSVRPPYSIKVGDNWVSYAGYDPIAGQIAAMATAAERGGGDVFSKDGMIGLVTGTAQSLVNSSYLTSVKNLLEVANETYDTAKGGDGAIPATSNFISGQLGNLVNPAFVRWYSQLGDVGGHKLPGSDIYARDGSGDGSLTDRTIGRILAGTPGASKTLPVKYDVFGRPILNARQTRAVEKDEAVLELSRLAKLTETKSLVAAVKKSDLQKVPDPTARDVQAYQYLRGSYIRESVRAAMKDGSWAEMTDAERVAETRAIMKDMGVAAREKLFPQFYLEEEEDAAE